MPRRILLLITDLKIGGTPTVVRELALRLRSPDVQVEVACLAPPGPVADELTAAGIPVSAFGATRRWNLSVVARLIRLVHHGSFDTVVSFLIHANACAAAARLFCPRARFLQSIQTTQSEPVWHWRLQRRIHRAAERIVVPSEAVAEAARIFADIPEDKITVIPNAIDPREFSPSPIPDQNPRPYPIGFIGRLDPIKRLPDLLEALHLLLTPGSEYSSIPPVHLHIFGDGPARASIESHIARLNLTPHVTLHGAIAHPQEALSKIGLLILPSAAEGFGLVLIEAAAARVPIIATDIPGIRDVVHHDHSALLVPAHSPAHLAAAIRKLLTDTPLRRRLTDTAFAAVHQHFTWDTVLPQYRDLLDLPSALSTQHSALPSHTPPPLPPSAASSTADAPTSTAPDRSE